MNLHHPIQQQEWCRQLHNFQAKRAQHFELLGPL
jgi:hypothetical protein